MSNAPVTRYTDRDVRESPELIAAAEDYLERYQGDFQFLVDCKMRVVNNIELSVGMIRGVLNCMRVDPRVRNLPEPREWDADLIPFPDAYQRQPRSRTVRQMKIIKRELRNGGNYAYRRPANLQPQFLFVKGKSASTIKVHLATRAEMEYFPRRFMDESGWAKKPELIVHTNCKFPYYMRNPKLLTADDVQANNDILVECEYCFSRVEDS